MKIKTTIVMELDESAIKRIGKRNDLLSKEKVIQDILEGRICLDDIIDECRQYYEVGTREEVTGAE